MTDYKHLRPAPEPRPTVQVRIAQLVDALTLARAALAQAEPIAEDAVQTAVECDVTPDALRRACKVITDARLMAELVLSLERGR